jgi:predicted nucleic acid-binding protein
MERSIIVVADTSPLNYLVLLGCPDILVRLYGTVLVPPAVLKELGHPNSPAEVQVWIANRPPWLELAVVGSTDPTLSATLGSGEREAISLALERRADAILIDDGPGRSAAKARNLTVNGTLFVVLEAALQGELDFELTLARLRQVGFRFSQTVEDEMRRRYLKRKTH